jgi:para-aminobenzoate synthetase component 1
MLAMSYELGSVFEPSARDVGSRKQLAWPVLVSQRIDNAYIFDHARQLWWAVGSPPKLSAEPAPAAFEVGTLMSNMGDGEYMRRVRRVLEYIRAGDVYQVNLAHRLRGSFSGSRRGLFQNLVNAAAPWMGAYMEFDDGDVPCAIASASPELFVEYSPVSRRITTRPMKGTRRGDASASQAGELRESVKDQAELTMIVDLMRNDLGRISELGSVRVETPRDIESHGAGTSGVLQATATVSATPNAGVTWLDVFRMIFPGGSVTGAPKIRAMQIIDELEPHPRGPYCGAIGYISDCGHAAFNIAIRTACVRGETVDYSVGAGLVADSDPASEWDETLLKAGVMRAAIGK